MALNKWWLLLSLRVLAITGSLWSCDHNLGSWLPACTYDWLWVPHYHLLVSIDSIATKFNSHTLGVPFSQHFFSTSVSISSGSSLATLGARKQFNTTTALPENPAPCQSKCLASEQKDADSASLSIGKWWVWKSSAQWGQDSNCTGTSFKCWK